MRRKNIDFIIELPCPQCGAPVKLLETQRYISCEYCRSSSYLFFEGGQRFVIKGNYPHGTDAIFVPYWRFKGVFYSCADNGLSHRFIDQSRIGISSAHIPPSLGLRGQTQVLRFINPEAEQITYLHETNPFSTLIDAFENQSDFRKYRNAYWNEYIGETISRIYLPFYESLDRAKRGRHLYDGILNRPITKISDELPAFFGGFKTAKPSTGVRFISGVCPDCGADLESDSTSLVLTCKLCQHVWQPTRKGLVSMKYGVLPGGSERSTYLPVWRIRAEVSGIALSSFGDYISIANLPRVRTEKTDHQPFYFWCLGTKLRPPHFINISQNICIAQPQEEIAPTLPDKGVLHPVTLPLSEAVESLKLILAGSMKPIRKYGPLLREIRITPKKVRLIYLPFRTGHHDLTNGRYHLSINRAMLHHARNL